MGNEGLGENNIIVTGNKRNYGAYFPERPDNEIFILIENTPENRQKIRDVLDFHEKHYPEIKEEDEGKNNV